MLEANEGLENIFENAVKEAEKRRHEYVTIEHVLLSLIKDNHIDFCGGLTQALEKTKAYLVQNALKTPVIVEVRNALEIDQVMLFPWVKRILLDNMPPEVLTENIKKINGKFETEASGNITVQHLVSYAETGVDYVSMGSLTYAAVPIDLSLKAV